MDVNFPSAKRPRALHAPLAAEAVASVAVTVHVVAAAVVTVAAAAAEIVVAAVAAIVETIVVAAEIAVAVVIKTVTKLLAVLIFWRPARFEQVFFLFTTESSGIAV
jgi:hypothetical protein